MNAEAKYGGKCKTEEGNKGIIMAENSKGGGRVEQTVCVVRVGLKEEWLLKRMLV